MPKSGSIDIPHVTVHDHWIRKPISKTEKKAVKEFIGLVAVNEKNPDAKTKATAYINYYEKFSKKEMYLDSAAKYLDVTSVAALTENIDIITKYYFFRNDNQSMLSMVTKLGKENLLNQILVRKSFENKHAWAAYRIAEAFANNNDLNNSEQFLKKAIVLAPYFSDFKNKLGANYQKQNRNAEAQQMFQDIVNEQPTYVPALSNLGYMFLLNGNLKLGEYYINKALSFDPDYELALLNKANLQLQKGNKKETVLLLKRVLQINPKNENAKKALAQLQNSI
jgi:tetratricopeptide (TPR) repeat protein